jgi:pantetheine-phosphate adenylyltransferase
VPNETLPSGAPTSLAATAPSEPSTPSCFPVVALGGTFDHLHAGHKILLSMAAWIASEKLIVGVTGTPHPFSSSVQAPTPTDDALLTRKANAHVLESLAQRTAAVRAFLHSFRPALAADIVPISDVYGPTGWDPNIQALVVSKETASGAASSAYLAVRISHAVSDPRSCKPPGRARSARPPDVHHRCNIRYVNKPERCRCGFA